MPRAQAAAHGPGRRRLGRRGFTLVELLITVSIIGIMASMVLFAMFQATEAAKAQKTRALITKLNSIIMQRYDSYRTRRVPFHFPEVSQESKDKQLASKQIAKGRVDCLRDLMRMEMPDRWSDVWDGPVAPMPHALPPDVLPAYGGFQISRPAVSEAYLRKFQAIMGAAFMWPPPNNVIDYQGAECLYMIVMEAIAQEGDAREFFKAGDIADTDGDGFPEFVDAWGTPIDSSAGPPAISRICKRRSASRDASTKTAK